MADLKRLAAVGLLGGAGGAFNAWLCFAKLPEPVHRFDPLVVPGGALHGAALAVVALGAALALARRPLLVKLAAAPLVGWFAGCLSWIPLERWAVGAPWSASVAWIARRGGTERLWIPFAYFGLVSLLLFLGWALAGVRRGVAASVAMGVTAGVLGSLWWWVEWERAYFAAIHGVVWGALVGLGAAAGALTSPAPPEPHARATRAPPSPAA